MSNIVSSQPIAELYRDHHGWLHGWLRKNLGCSHRAADLAHDTFLRLLTERRERQVMEPRALLTHIAKCLVIDHWRRLEVERAYLETLALHPEPEAPSPEEQLLVVETLLRIDAMLAGLPARTRDTFLLAQLDGLTLKEISARTGTALITVRRDIHKALLACMTAL